MKWSKTPIIIILVFLGIGWLLEPVFFPEPQKPVEKPKVEPLPPKPKEPEPTPTPEPDEPEPEPIPDEPDEPEDTDPDSDDVKPITPVIGEDDGRRPVNEEKFSGSLSVTSWHNPKAVERRLATQIRNKLRTVDRAKVMEFIMAPENRLMIAQWDMLHRCDLDALSKLMSDHKVANSLAPLLNDLPWVSSFVYDGENNKPEVALAMINHFRQVDPNMDRDVVEDTGDVKPGVKRRIASAVAVQFSRNQWYGEGRELTEKELKDMADTGTPAARGSSRRNKDKEKKDHFRLARERYLYFSKSWDDGLLHSKFGTLPDWLMHFVCGWKSEMKSPFGSATSLRWQRDNVSAPARNFTGMAYQVEYLPLNVFGDTIFTSWYYEPFSAIQPGLHSKVVRDVGGVCGSLSHFGASSAVANGVPAITMGEPGHCAYSVYLDGKWVPCNSISEKRGSHWSCWGMSTWSALQMYTAMYEDGQRTRNAQLICALGDLFAAKNSPNSALKLYEMSMTMQPLNNAVWMHYLETAAKSLRSPAKYLGVNDYVCTSVAPTHPEMCAHYLKDIIYPSMLKALRTPKQKLIAFGSYFSHLDQNEKAEWDIEGMLDAQYESLGKANTFRESYFKMIAESVHKHPDFGVALSWALRRAYAESKNLGEKVRQMVDKLLADTPDDEENADTRTQMNAAVVRAAEESGLRTLNANSRLNTRERDFYISLADTYSKDYLEADEGAKPMPNFTAPGGNLISPGGLVMLDAYAPDQKIIAKHAAALTSTGGRISSEKGKHRKLIIELPKKSYIGGVVIVPASATCGKYRDWFIETSADGKNWQLLQNLPDSSDKPCLVLDVKHNPPNAKFIRIDSGAEQNQGIDFQAILVYDNKKAK